MRSRQNMGMSRQTIGLIIVLFVMLIVLLSFLFSGKNDNVQKTDKQVQSQIDDKHDETNENAEENVISMQIAAAGDIMFHDDQLVGAYDETTDSYDFSPFFTEVKGFFEAADLALANFETTTAGSRLPYSGYPQFNSPDESIIAVKEAGIDALTTVNNHSLDTGSEGLKRTARMMEKFDMPSVGTYAEEPDSRILWQDVKGIKTAIIAYTESTNGNRAQYAPAILNAMINLMDEEIIKADINEAKENDADLIIAFMHWGEEYMTEPNEKQISFAKMMADEGVDIILGSHPHVIQPSEMINTGEKDTFVIYSLGNFVSNQRRETLGADFAQTEDGVIVLIDVEKNLQNDEVTITNVDYVPTWVLREKRENETYDYRILPIEQSIDNGELNEEYKNRMEQSYETTTGKLKAKVMQQ